MNKRVVWTAVLIIGMAVVFASCAGMMTKPTASNFKDPVIKLESFMVPQYDGFWYYAGSIKPTQGKPGDRGAPLPMSFLFAIQNPNPYPIALDGFKYTVVFDKEFSLVTVNNQDTYYIPANMTNYVRSTTMITARSALLSILVTGGFKLKEKGWSPWQALERWWTGVPEIAVPVEVKEGSFEFSADGVTKVLPFEAMARQ